MRAIRAARSRPRPHNFFGLIFVCYGVGISWFLINFAVEIRRYMNINSLIYRLTGRKKYCHRTAVPDWNILESWRSSRS